MQQQYGYAQQGIYGQQGNYGQQFGYTQQQQHQQIGFGLQQQQQQVVYGNTMVRSFIYLFESQCTQCSMHITRNISYQSFFFSFQPDLNTLTHGRLLLEKFFYLNSSNAKYIAIGIVPSSKLVNDNSCGFYVDVILAGGKMKPMSIGGMNGFLNLCQSLRGFEELQFTYPASASSYDDIQDALPLNISKRMWNGSLCFDIETINEDRGSIAQNSASQILKCENLILANIKKLQSLVVNIESQFNGLIKNCCDDYTATIKNTQMCMDTFAADLFCNFDDLVKYCVDRMSRRGGEATRAAATTTAAIPKRRKPSAAATRRPKKPKIDVAVESASTEAETENYRLLDVSDEGEEVDQNIAVGDEVEPIYPLIDVSGADEEVETITAAEEPITAALEKYI